VELGSLFEGVLVWAMGLALLDFLVATLQHFITWLTFSRIDSLKVS